MNTAEKTGNRSGISTPYGIRRENAPYSPTHFEGIRYTIKGSRAEHFLNRKEARLYTDAAPP